MIEEFSGKAVRHIVGIRSIHLGQKVHDCRPPFHSVVHDIFPDDHFFHPAVMLAFPPGQFFLGQDPIAGISLLPKDFQAAFEIGHMNLRDFILPVILQGIFVHFPAVPDGDCAIHIGTGFKIGIQKPQGLQSDLVFSGQRTEFLIRQRLGISEIILPLPLLQHFLLEGAIFYFLPPFLFLLQLIRIQDRQAVGISFPRQLQDVFIIFQRGQTFFGPPGKDIAESHGELCQIGFLFLGKGHMELLFQEGNKIPERRLHIFPHSRLESIPERLQGPFRRTFPGQLLFQSLRLIRVSFHAIETKPQAPELFIFRITDPGKTVQPLPGMSFGEHAIPRFRKLFVHLKSVQKRKKSLLLLCLRMIQK